MVASNDDIEILSTQRVTGNTMKKTIRKDLHQKKESTKKGSVNRIRRNEDLTTRQKIDQIIEPNRDEEIRPRVLKQESKTVFFS